MPSQTFLNLDSKKQQKLLDAAMEEFSTVRYTEASVNHIIQQAEFLEEVFICILLIKMIYLVIF